MTIQFDETTRHARADAVETSIGASPVLKFRSGAVPAACVTADSGTVLATLTLPADWMAAAASGAKAKAGTWEDASADAGGTIAHFRIYDSGGTCRMQGSVTATGGGGDLTVNNVAVEATQAITIVAFGWTEPHA
jgi:hypothetical protein